jgi:hypothetical protein
MLKSNLGKLAGLAGALLLCVLCAGLLPRYARNVTRNIRRRALHSGSLALASQAPATTDAAHLVSVANTGATGSGTVSSSAVSSSNYVTIVNGQPWPLNFDPFCNSSAQQCPWNNPLPDNPAAMANSASLISNLFASGSGMTGLVSKLFGWGGGLTGLPDAAIQGGSTKDFAHPIYLASNDDPLVTIGAGCGDGAGSTGSQIHIPAKARPTTSTDAHMGVIQPNGEEWDFWSVPTPSRDWRNGDTISCQESGGHSNIVTGSGSLPHSATSGAALSAGNLRVNELENGVIPHALFVVVPTELVRKGYIVYPGQSASGGRGGIPIGARIQLKWTDAQIDAMTGQAAWEKTLLHQLHDYGLYILDCGGDGWITYKWESPTQYTSFGGSNPGAAWNSANSPPATWRPAGINWATDLQIVDPCYAAGNCTGKAEKRRGH